MNLIVLIVFHQSLLPQPKIRSIFAPLTEKSFPLLCEQVSRNTTAQLSVTYTDPEPSNSSPQKFYVNSASCLSVVQCTDVDTKFQVMQCKTRT